MKVTSTPLGIVRLRLTVWHVATFGVILALLGAGLFVAIQRQLQGRLEVSLHAATLEVAHAAGIREMEAAARGRVVDAVDELHIPERTLYLLDTAGTPIRPDTAARWIREAARRTARAGMLDLDHEAGDEITLRLHAMRFRLPGGEPRVAVAVADRIELEDRYADLVRAFGIAALAALLLIAGGSWLLVRKSTEPIAHSFDYMRRFMADAAHELRTPITVIRNRAGVALQQPRAPSEYEAALQGIEAETQRLGRIVEQLLTLARADSGELPLERRRTFLDDITSDAAEAARAVAESRGVDLRVEEFEEAVVDGDAEYLRQLVMILLDNAIKFTPAGGVVRVHVGSAGGRASLVVEDTGIGIEAADLPHVFERFYRADAARTRQDSSPRSGGAGLGLAIARWIAEAHGAAINLQSSPGTGTRASVTFPALMSSS